MYCKSTLCLPSKFDYRHSVAALSRAAEVVLGHVREAFAEFLDFAAQYALSAAVDYGHNVVAGAVGLVEVLLDHRHRFVYRHAAHHYRRRHAYGAADLYLYRRLRLRVFARDYLELRQRDFHLGDSGSDERLLAAYLDDGRALARTYELYSIAGLELLPRRDDRFRCVFLFFALYR